MCRLSLCLLVSLGLAGLARGHELPDDEIERRVQISVKPDCVLVEYSLWMNEATLRKELRRHGEKPVESLADNWGLYQDIILSTLPQHMNFSVDGKDGSLEPLHAVYSGWSHRYLNCLFRGEVLLSGEPKRVVLTDRNFVDTPGEYRIALKARSGASLRESNAAALLTNAEPVRLAELPEQQKRAATRAEGEFFVSEPSKRGAEELFPVELVHFVPYRDNPVFAGTGTETWDRKIRERGCILRHGGKWHLWYTGYTGERAATKMLGYATSPDGLVWKRHPQNPVFDASWTEDVHVVRHGDLFYMVAEGRGDIPHLLTSRDGVRWEDHGRLDVRNRDGSKLSPGPYGTPTLWIEDGTWHLFYERGDRGVWLAKSMDAKTWTNVQDDPVLSRGPSDYDQHAIALNQVIRYRDRYFAVYHANGDPNWKAPWTTCLAVSDDLVTWTKYPENPIIRTNDSSGQLVHDGQRYRLYTMHPDVRVHFPRR